MGHNTGILSFGKIRASWAQVGNDTDAYMLRDYYNISYDIKGGILSVNSVGNNATILPFLSYHKLHEKNRFPQII